MMVMMVVGIIVAIDAVDEVRIRKELFLKLLIGYNNESIIKFISDDALSSDFEWIRPSSIASIATCWTEHRDLERIQLIRSNLLNLNSEWFGLRKARIPECSERIKRK